MYLIWPWERRELVSEELKQVIEELLDYFQMDEPDWPLISIYSKGEFISGVIDDELYSILTQLGELKDEL